MNYVDYHGLVYSFRFLINFIESYNYKSLYYIVYNKCLKNLITDSKRYMKVI